MAIGLGAAILGGAGISAAGSLLGGLFGGKKPKVPELKPIDFAKEQQQAIQQNIASLEPATELAKKTTAAEQSQLESQLRRAIPGYDQLVSQAGQNIAASLRGEISPEVSAQVQRSTAGRALSGGFGAGSGFGRALASSVRTRLDRCSSCRSGVADAASNAERNNWICGTSWRRVFAIRNVESVDGSASVIWRAVRWF